MSDSIKRIVISCTEPKCLIDNDNIKVSIFNESQGKFILSVTTIDLTYMGGKPNIILTLKK